MNPILISLLTFLLTAGLVYTAADARSRRAATVRDRLDRITGSFRLAPGQEAHLTAQHEPRPDVLPTVTHWLGGSDFEKRLRLAMIRADLRWRPAEWVILCTTVAIGGGLVGLLATRLALTGLVIGALGFCLPLMILKMRQEARQRKFEAQTPDMLMLMTASLRAGHSFAQAMEMVATEMPQPLSSEFAWASGEVKLGVPLETALGRMWERVPSADLDLIITAILIQLPLGGNLAEVLDAIAGTIRERVRVQGEVKTLTAEGRLSALVLIILAPALALLLFLRNPAYFQPLIESTLGRSLIIEAVVGQVIGALIIKTMVALEL